MNKHYISKKIQSIAPIAYHNIKQLNEDRPGFTFIHPLVNAYHPWVTPFIATRMFPLRTVNNGLSGKWNVKKNITGISTKRLV